MCGCGSTCGEYNTQPTAWQACGLASVCTIGYYSSSASSTVCNIVPAGSFATVNGVAVATGATGATPCPAGNDYAFCKYY